MKTMTAFKVETWLPVFSGFYGTIWEPEGDEEMEMDNINSERADKHLPPVEYDDVEWDNEGYENAVSRGMTKSIGHRLKELNVIESMEFQKLSSPREYNFANDSIWVEMTLTNSNVRAVAAYLNEHKAEFAKYIEDSYTSCDGFCSSYSNDADLWTVDLDATLHDTHKLGAVLNFVLLNEEPEIEMEIYQDLRGNGCTLSASNYDKLIGA